MKGFFPQLAIRKGAWISEDEKYRYTLWRIWDDSLSKVMFVGLNPSTADANKEDATSRRFMSFAKAWGCGGYIACNLFALRARDPNELHNIDDPIGPKNNDALISAALEYDILVACWGVSGQLLGRGKAVFDMLNDYTWQCLGITKQGHPRHPLYLPADSKLRKFSV